MLLKRLVAEFIGTFGLLFFGCGAICVLQNSGAASHLSITLVFGLVLLILISALGPICAAHFNPAVTLGFAVAGRFSWRYVLPYWVAQIGGALAAIAMLAWLIPAQANAAHFGATLPTLDVGKAVVLEALLTFTLMLVITAVATDKRVTAPTPAIAIGLVLTIAGLFAGPLTGASLNPARSLAPALFAGPVGTSSLWIYLVGPFVGAVLAALLYEWLRLDRSSGQCAPDWEPASNEPDRTA